MKNTRIFLMLACAFLISFALSVKAQNVFDIQFPIAELGNCASMQECKAYCDDKNNAQSCASWAEAKGFKKPAPPPPQKAGQAPIRQQAVSVLAQKSGPGGCKTGEECNVYCSQSEHAQECFSFAKEHNLISQEEVSHIEEKIQSKEGPGGCRSFQECDAFCRNPDNAKTCLEFSVKEGKITQEDADFLMQRAQERKGPPQGQPPRGPKPPQPRKPEGPKIDEVKAKQLLEETGGPGGCNSMEVCEQFCSTPGNEEICMNFAAEHNLMPKEEVEKFKKVMSATGPGGCRGRACEQYCENPEHEEECLNFAVENGFMDKKDAEEAKKFINIAKSGGPGGCHGQRECDVFCSKSENREECFNFAKNNNLIPPEEIEKIEKEKEIFTKLESTGGPGGCKGPRECFEYCSNSQHMQECFEFGSKQGMIPQENMRRIEELRQNMPETGMEEEHFEERNEFRREDMMMGDFGTSSEFKGYPKPPMDRFGAPEGMEDKFREIENVCSDPNRFEECVKLKQNLGAPFQEEGQFVPPQGKFQPMMLPKEGEYRQDFQQQYPTPMMPEFQKDDEEFRGDLPMGQYPSFPQPTDKQYPRPGESGMYPQGAPYQGGYPMPPQGSDGGMMPMRNAPENYQGFTPQNFGGDGGFAPIPTQQAPMMPAPEPYKQPQSKVFKLLLSNPILMLIDLLR